MKDKRLLIIFLTVFIDLVGFGMIIPLNPYLAENFGASPLMVGVLMSVYSLMQFVFSPIWGSLSDRVGRRPIILWSLFGASLAHTAFAFAPSLSWLIGARALAGLFGGNISTAMAYIADITDDKNRSKGMGLVGAAFGLGFILGPTLGGVFAEVGKSLGDQPPWGASFPALVAAGICALNGVSAFWFLPESLKTSVQRQSASRFRRIQEALNTPVLGGLMLLTFLSGLAMAHVEASLFLLMQDRFSWSLTQASFGFGYIGIILVFTQGFLVRRLIPAWGERRTLQTGLLFAFAGFALIGLSYSLPWMTLAVTALGIGHGLVNPSLSGSVSLVSRANAQGQNLGVSQSLASLARIVGPATGGAIYQALDPGAPFAVAALLSLVSTFLVLRWRQQLPEGGRV